MVTEPAPTIVTTPVLETVATEGSLVVYVIGKPDVEEEVNGKAGSPNTLVPVIGSKVTVCVFFDTVNVCVTEGAALYVVFPV